MMGALSSEILTGETVELLQEMIRNRCVNDGTTESGFETRNADLLEIGRASCRERVSPRV